MFALIKNKHQTTMYRTKLDYTADMIFTLISSNHYLECRSESVECQTLLNNSIAKGSYHVATDQILLRYICMKLRYFCDSSLITKTSHVFGLDYRYYMLIL